jgi:hypothetical protein
LHQPARNVEWKKTVWRAPFLRFFLLLPPVILNVFSGRYNERIQYFADDCDPLCFVFVEHDINNDAVLEVKCAMRSMKKLVADLMIARDKMLHSNLSILHTH